jgi:hypothetical protein
MGLGRSFSFLILYIVDRTPWWGHQPVARPVPTHRTTPPYTHIHICHMWDSNTHDARVRGSEGSSCYRPRGHYDRQFRTLPFGLHCIWNPTGKNTTIFLILDTHSHVVMLCFFFPAGLVLNEFIRHFEPAVYDRDALMTQHKRLRRDVTSASQPLRLHIKTNSR